MECDQMRYLFNIFTLAVLTRLPMVLQCLDPISKRKSSAANMASSFEFFSL